MLVRSRVVCYSRCSTLYAIVFGACIRSKAVGWNVGVPISIKKKGKKKKLRCLWTARSSPIPAFGLRNIGASFVVKSVIDGTANRQSIPDHPQEEPLPHRG